MMTLPAKAMAAVISANLRIKPAISSIAKTAIAINIATTSSKRLMTKRGVRPNTQSNAWSKDASAVGGLGGRLIVRYRTLLRFLTRFPQRFDGRPWPGTSCAGPCRLWHVLDAAGNASGLVRDHQGRLGFTVIFKANTERGRDRFRSARFAATSCALQPSGQRIVIPSRWRRGILLGLPSRQTSA